MDATWFKRQQRKLGVTSFDLGNAINRDRSVISKILNGRQRMTLDQARAFAAVLQVPFSEMVERAGLVETTEARELAPGFAASDAVKYEPSGHEAIDQQQIKAGFNLDRSGVDVWRVKSRCMMFGGILEEDFLLVDLNQAERVRSGDVVIAQVHNNAQGTSVTMLRRFEPPVLVGAGPDAAEARVHVVDGVNVVIKGKVLASWRSFAQAR